jgi:chromosomal replication initiator protein
VKVDDEPLTVDEIVETVCNHYHVSTAAMNSRSRKRELVVPRQVSMYLAQKLTNMPASRIGKLVGGRDHSTVIHSCNTIEQRLKIDKGFSEEVSSIERSFRLKKK